MFTGKRDSSDESRNRLSIKSSGSTVRARGSSTSRTSSADSSRTSPSSGAFFSLNNSASCSISRPFCTPYGISVTTATQPPRPVSSLIQRERSRNEPRPVR